MYVISSFEYSRKLELALSELEVQGLEKSAILAVPLHKRRGRRKLLDSIHRSDGRSSLDIAAMFGMIGMLLGVIYGFVLYWGPIIWGVAGLGAGLMIGYILDRMKSNKRRSAPSEKNRRTEVFVMVHCESKDVPRVEEVLWNHGAFAVGLLDRGG